MLTNTAVKQTRRLLEHLDLTMLLSEATYHKIPSSERVVNYTTMLRVLGVLHIGNFFLKGGLQRVSSNYIAGVIGINARTVRRALNHLVTLGLLSLDFDWIPKKQARSLIHLKGVSLSKKWIQRAIWKMEGGRGYTKTYRKNAAKFTARLLGKSTKGLANRVILSRLFKGAEKYLNRQLVQFNDFKDMLLEAIRSHFSEGARSETYALTLTDMVITKVLDRG